MFYWELTEGAWPSLQGGRSCHVVPACTTWLACTACNTAGTGPAAAALHVRTPAATNRLSPPYASPQSIHSTPPPCPLHAEAAPAAASVQQASWAAALQRSMCDASQFYAALCTKRMLGPAELRLVRPGAFSRLREAAVQRGAAPEQCKPPVALKREWERQVLEGCRWCV